MSRGSWVAGLVLSVGCALWLSVAVAAAEESAEAKAEDTAEAKAEQQAGNTAQSVPVAETEDEKALLKRARAYWDLRVQTSTKVYEFYPPEVQATGRYPAEFAGVYYKSYQIEYVVTKGDRGMVVVQAQQLLDPKLASRLKGKDVTDKLKARIGEEWVRVEGTWYKKPNYGGLSRFMDPRRHSKSPSESSPAGSKAPQGADGGAADGGKQVDKAAEAASKAQE